MQIDSPSRIDSTSKQNTGILDSVVMEYICDITVKNKINYD